MTALQLILGGWLAAILGMSVLWLVQRRTGNAGVVDVGWAAMIGLLAIVYALLADGTAEIGRAHV